MSENMQAKKHLPHWKIPCLLFPMIQKLMKRMEMKLIQQFQIFLKVQTLINKLIILIIVIDETIGMEL